MSLTRTRGLIALGVTLVTVAGTASAVAAPARPFTAPKPARVRTVKGNPERVSRRTWTAPASVTPTHTAYPKPGRYHVVVPGAGRWQQLGTTGLSVAATGSSTPVDVEVLDQASAGKLGLSGITLRVSRSTGAGLIEVGVSRSLLAGLYGGDYAGHVRWLMLPDCASAARCARPTPAPATPDTGVVAASTQLASTGAVLMVAASSPGGTDGSGSFGATSLSPSSQWNVSPQTGDYSWDYPLGTPPPAGGSAPSLALSYDSGSIDGQTGTTNNQTSAVGSGWDLSGAGFIERSYLPCSVNGPAGSGDECWNGENISVSLSGHSGALVQDTSGVWHLDDDDNTKVEHLTNDATLCGNGTYDNDCWRLTAADGTQYYFGRNHLPGWTSPAQDTNSTWTVPVCGTAATACTGALGSMTPFNTQAWRWNLDYVVDPHGNSMAYYYSTETNHYGQNGSTTASATYIRAGLLKRIDYGLHAGAELTATAPDQVVFTPANRCLTGSTCDPATLNSDWPDVPGWANCTTSNCGTNISPSYWSTQRLAAITTQYWNGTAYVPVNTWTLSQSWPNPLDGTDPSMQLDKISRTGKVGGTATVPDTTFTYQMLQNRVVISDGIVPLMKPRLSQINLDSGGQVHVSYLTSDCSAGALPAAPQTNTKRCFPQYWAPPGMAKQLDWFNKYLVSQVVADPVYGRSWTDPGANADTTTYDYTVGTPAWRFDTSPMVADKSRTWSVFAGYNKVRVERGDPATPATLQTTDYTYLRGLDDDLQDTAGTKRSIQVVPTFGPSVTDSLWWAGSVLETQVYNGKGGPLVTDTVTTPYASTATATGTAVTEHIGTSATTFTYTPTARHTGTADVTTRTTLSAGGWRTTDTTTSHDGLGRVSQVDDHGDTATTTDDRCTTTSYADDTTPLRLAYPSEVKTVGVNCTTTPTFPHDAISDTRTSYDNQAPGAAPTVGDITKTEIVKDYDADTGAPTWITTATTAYDALGRASAVTDVLNRSASTDYTPTAPPAGSAVSGNIGPVTQTVTTNAAGWQSTTLENPAWGSPTSQTDPNGHTTTATYDPLGRRTAVWAPDRQPAANFPTPSLAYAYNTPASNGTPTGPDSVATTSLTPSGGTATSYVIYDGLLRARQTQTPAEGTTATSEFTAPGTNGTIVTDTLYDDAGQISIANDGYYNSNAPSGTLWVPTHGEADIPTQTQTVHDGAGRTTAVITEALGLELWRTSSTYGGDHVDVTPPAGGTATTTYTDARGNTTKLLQYHAATPTGPADTTTYTYNPAGERASMTDATGQNTWTWAYDVLGRQTSATDPDTGTTTAGYDDAGRVTSTTDARGDTLAYGYDTLDRKTGQYQTSTSGPLIASWTYDTLAGGGVEKGQLASSTSYVGSVAGTPGTPYTQQVTGYDAADRPLGTSYVIPSVTGQAALAGTYTTTLTYNPDGSPAQQKDPAMGGLPAETLKTNYTRLGDFWSYGGQSSYVNNTIYDQLGRITKLDQFNSAHRLDSTYVYDAATNRLTSDTVTTDAASNNVVAATTYTYDHAGDITAIATTASATATDTQCFSYDYLQRLTRAFTPANGNCTQTPTGAGLGGPAPYWQDYGYDTAGNRASLTTHTATTTQTDTYTYPAPGAAQPHTLQTVTHAPGGTDTYHYDTDGNTTTAPGQTLTWNPTGQIATVTAAGNTQTRTYDADGNLLLQSDPVNGTVLYLGDAELHLATNGTTVTGQRLYTAAGHAVASRAATAGISGSTITWLATDPQTTATTEYNPTAGTPTVRRYDPFGNTRGTNPTWANDRGYLNAPADPFTTTTQLGARTYQPTLGRFLTDDPILDTGDPQSINGYAYADNNPATNTDPTGAICGNDGGNANCNRDGGQGSSSNGASPRPNPNGGYSYTDQGDDAQHGWSNGGHTAPKITHISRPVIHYAAQATSPIIAQAKFNAAQTGQPDGALAAGCTTQACYVRWHFEHDTVWNRITAAGVQDANPTCTHSAWQIGVCYLAVGISVAAGATSLPVVDGLAGETLSGAADTAATGGRSVDEVLNNLPKGKQSFVRTVPDEQTLQSTFGELTRGGTPTTWKGYNGQVFELQDGTQIGMRGTSSSGGSTIDIRVPGQDPFKIHIG